MGRRALGRRATGVSLTSTVHGDEGPLSRSFEEVAATFATYATTPLEEWSLHDDGAVRDCPGRSRDGVAAAIDKYAPSALFMATVGP